MARDERELLQAVSDAKDFKELKEDPRFKRLINLVATQTYFEWSSTDDGVKAKDLWNKIRGMKAFTKTIDALISDGRVAEKELQAQERASQGEHGSRPITGELLSQRQRDRN